MIERQVIVTWHRPEEKLPPEGVYVYVTFSGRRNHANYDHAPGVAAYWAEDNEWDLETFSGISPMQDLKVHAWADLDVYKGE